MTTFDIDKTAPAIGRAETVIAAPIAAVWARLSDIADWPDWNSGVDWMSACVPLEPGATFEWRAGGMTIRSRLQAVEAPYLLGWTGSALFISARHVCRLTDLGAATRVTRAESFRGAYARALPAHARRQIDKALAQGLGDLKAVCEGRTRRQSAA